MAFRLLKSKGKNGKNKGYRCGVNRAQVEWLALNAFRRVLARRQSRHRQTIAWLNERIAGMRARQYVMCERMEGVIRESIDTG
ncbi:hypothetical protein F5884DRAFT_179234 [Xylogone sp. PMI_703]|nr:hypothetical protein F5884DRAFT_179234 [Xylogone sp. PMI_703]